MRQGSVNKSKILGQGTATPQSMSAKASLLSFPVPTAPFHSSQGKRATGSCHFPNDLYQMFSEVGFYTGLQLQRNRSQGHTPETPQPSLDTEEQDCRVWTPLQVSQGTENKEHPLKPQSILQVIFCQVWGLGKDTVRGWPWSLGSALTLHCSAHTAQELKASSQGEKSIKASVI